MIADGISTLNQVDRQARSYLEILMAKYNFSRLDILNKIDEKEEDLCLMYGISDTTLLPSGLLSS